MKKNTNNNFNMREILNSIISWLSIAHNKSTLMSTLKKIGLDEHDMNILEVNSYDTTCLSNPRVEELLNNFIDWVMIGESISNSINQLVEIGFTKESLEYFGFCKNDIDFALS